MKRVTRAKRAAKSTAVDSPAEEAVDNEVDCVDSPVVKPKRKSRKEEVVDSDVEEEKEVEGKKSKRKTRKEEVQGSDIEEKEVEEKKTKKRGKKKTTSSSKRKSRSSKFYDHHSSDEGSAEDIRDTAIELKNPKSDKQKQDENQTEEKQVQDVQEKHDQDARLAEKRENTDQKDSQDKKVNEEREFNKNSEEKKDDRKSQEKTSQEKGDRDNCDEEMKSVKKDNKIVQDHEDKKNSEHVSLEKVSKKASEIENIIVQDILTENISKKQNETRNNNLRTNAEEEPKQEIKQSKEISNQEIQPIQDSIQDVLTEKVTESDLEIEKVLEPDNSKEEIEKSSEKEICGEKTGEPAFQKESTPKTDGHQKSEKRHTKSDAKDKNRREVKVREDLDKKLSEEQEQSKDIPREKIIGDSNDENALNKSDVVSSQEESTENGPSTPFVLNRKRKWGSRPAKITTQKSLTISTDVLKDIIPDVKPVEFDEVIEHKKHEERRRETEKIHKPILPKIVIDNTVRTDNIKNVKKEEGATHNEPQPLFNRKVSIVKENDIIMKPLSPPRNKSSSILHITNLVRPFTLPQLKNLLQRTGRIVEDGFWIDRIKSKCYVKYETEDQAVETRHALHGVTWPISNPKALQVDFSTDEAFDKAKISEENPATPASTIPGTVEDWLREQDLKKARDDLEKPWQRKAAVREWDVGKGDKEKEHPHREEKPDRRRHRTPERHSPEPAKKFKKKEEEAPAKLLDDLFRKTKTTPCIYWLPLSTETIAVKEEQRRVHMLEHERRMQEIRRQRRH